MKWLKFFIGLALIPALFAQIFTLIDFAALWIPSEPWRSLWFWSVFGGAGLWLLIFFCLPRPMWIYVLSHELTHALAVFITGGKVFRFKVETEGGHVISDKSGWWISLSPYFVPLYTLLWLAIWWSIHFYYPLTPYQFLLFGGIGFSYAFHATFTISMLHPGQTDLSGEGYLFSAVVIFLINLVLLTLFFLLMTRALHWDNACNIWLSQLRFCYGLVGTAAVYLFKELLSLISGKK